MRYILSMFTVFFCDLLIKNKAEHSLKPGTEASVFGDKVRLKLYHNKGAMLNVGEKKPAGVIFISLSLCILLTVILLISLVTGRSSRFKTALSLLLGGAWSNAYDRLTRGYVVDYVSFPFAGRLTARLFGEKAGRFVSNIVFNISDFFIIGGCLLTAIFGSD